MSELLSEKMSSDMGSLATSQSSQFLGQLAAILDKLKADPSSVTIDDARLLSESFTPGDEKAESSHAQADHRSLLTAVKDLHAAVDGSPEEVTTEILRTTQSIVSKMQKALGHTNVPHPEVEGELEEEIAKIEPKIVQGTVTKAEAGRLHSLESRAKGHTEKGGVTAAAQSVAARRERQLSLSGDPKTLHPSNTEQLQSGEGSFTSSEHLSQHDKEEDLQQVADAAKDKTEEATATKEEASHLHGKDENLRQAELVIRPKIQDGTVTAAEANMLHSCEMRAHGHTEKGGLAATAQSIVAHRQRTLSGISNSPLPSETDAGARKEDADVGKESKKVEGDLGEVSKTENEAQ